MDDVNRNLVECPKAIGRQAFHLSFRAAHGARMSTSNRLGPAGETLMTPLAAELLERCGYNPERVLTDTGNVTGAICRSIAIDDVTIAFAAAHPDAQIVTAGIGLCTRHDRRETFRVGGRARRRQLPPEDRKEGICRSGDLAEVDIGDLPKADDAVERRLRHRRGLWGETHPPVGLHRGEHGVRIGCGDAGPDQTAQERVLNGWAGDCCNVAKGQEPVNRGDVMVVCVLDEVRPRRWIEVVSPERPASHPRHGVFGS